MAAVTLADAKARLSELVERALGGEAIQITRRGKPVVEIVALAPRAKLDVDALRRASAALPQQTESAADFVRRMRDEDRY